MFGLYQNKFWIQKAPLAQQELFDLPVIFGDVCFQWAYLMVNVC